MQNRVVSIRDLQRKLNLYNDEYISEADLSLPVAITPYIMSELAGQSNDSYVLRKQFLPTIDECVIASEQSLDCLDEHEFMVAPHLIKRYPNKVAIIATNCCACYCRYCTRRRIFTTADRPVNDLSKALAYIKHDTRISDVLITGGDPLVLEDQVIDRILEQLRRIEHIKIVRIGTRAPIVLPMRVTTDFIGILKKNAPIFMNIHVSHYIELTEPVQCALNSLADAGIQLGSQTVLLRGINDSKEILKMLFYSLLCLRVKPYYLYHCDNLSCCRHFFVPVGEGIQLVNSLQGTISGMAIPKYVIDVPGAIGKRVLAPSNIIVATNEDEIIIKSNDEYIHYPIL